MKKLATPVLAVVLVLAACGSGGEVAATVDGVDITVEEVEGLVAPANGADVPIAQFADLLSFNIVLDVFTRGANDDFDISFNDEEIAAEADEIINAELTGEQSREDFLAEREVTEELLQMIAHQSLIQTAILEQMQTEVTAPTQEELDAFFEEAGLMVCASHILVQTEAEADEVVTRLEAGEDFAQVATEVSIDGSADAGGDLGCDTPDSYVPEFAEAISTAEVGVPTAPVESEFGFHVILLREDELPSDEEATASLESQAAQVASQAWFVEKAAAAEVEVNEKYGTWETEPTPGVVPPSGTTTTTG